MSRPLGLARPFALLLAVLVLSLTTFSVASASANDEMVRSAVVIGMKQWQRESKVVSAAMPKGKDLDSPAYASEYAAGVEQLDAPLARYGAIVKSEHGSTGAGRKGRKLMLQSIDELRKHFALAAKLSRAFATGVQPSDRDSREVNRLLSSSSKHERSAYKLLWGKR